MKDENSVRAVAARGLQHHEGSICIHGEVREWLPGSPVVTWLRSGMNDQRDIASQILEQLEDLPAVSYVYRPMPVIAKPAFQFFSFPCGGRFGSEEITSKIIVDADNAHSLVV